MASLKQIAAATNLAEATVSRILRNRDQCSPETRHAGAGGVGRGDDARAAAEGLIEIPPRGGVRKGLAAFCCRSPVM